MNYSTSGTTGRPKYFRLSKSQIEARIARVPLYRPPGWENVRSIYSDFSSSRVNITVQWVHRHGGEVHHLFEHIREHKPDVILGSPAGLVKIANVVDNLYHPMFVINVSATLTPEDSRVIRSKLGNSLWSSYGTTEVGTISLAHADDIEKVPGCVGKLIPGTEVKFEDGLLWVKTPTMIEGYLEDPVSSMKFFKGGWFMPGDTGHMTDDGLLVLTGRTG